MIWEGLGDRQLCELFKDPAHNGHRTVDGIVKHMNTPLVLWGWHPGEGRTPIPLPESEFLAKVKNGLRTEQPVPAKSVHPHRKVGLADSKFSSDGRALRQLDRGISLFFIRGET
jgi:hypothetical protein